MSAAGRIARGARLGRGVGLGLARARLAHGAGLALLALALAAAGGASAARRAAPHGEGRVLVMRLEGPVSPVTAQALVAGIDRAEREGYRALVVEIDTPGGLESSMRDMVKRMLASKVPILTWVTPGGARAASAGVFVTMAGDVAAMSPGTNIGAATPINLQGPMDSTLARKATNDAAAFARTVAAQRGRSVAWAERAVRAAVAASETEAVDLGVVDFVAATLPELLAKADGHTWKRGSERNVLHVRGLPHDRIEPGFRQRLLAILAEPSVAYILLMLGFYGILFELQNPGAILPGVVGGICLILAFFALSTLPVNYAGVALILLAIVFFLAEIKVASHGMLAAGGVISMLLGSIMLFQSEGPRLPWTVIIGATLGTAAFFLLVVGAGLRAQRIPVRTGPAGLRGKRALTVERLAPAGMVRVGGELWQASAEEGVVEVGSEVEVMGVDGLTLKVRRLAKEARR
ncbi:MAG TPA: nodulation protein NfeD [Candidatus Eisenbacteria bacterium]|jgi:membrane-bound serine protease (ClpP class)